MASKIILCHYLLILIVILGILLRTSPVSPRPIDNSSMRLIFDEWKTLHGKSYPLASEEDDMRFEIFKENVNHIRAFNSKPDKSNYKLEINKFADLTNDEFSAIYASGYKWVDDNAKPNELVGSVSGPRFRYEGVSVESKMLDWRKKGVVTPVKEQDQCGCCWAFSAVAAVEGLNKLKTGELVSLSEQQLLDCDGGDKGCHGGRMDTAFNFIHENNGLAAENDYHPYTAREGRCNENAVASAMISGYESVPANNETALLQAVAHQPVSVAINGATRGLQLYHGGIYDVEAEECDLNHGVAVVGYGTTAEGVDYWIVKNSWGSGWGEYGYARIRRGHTENEGICGLAMDASYPTP